MLDLLVMATLSSNLRQKCRSSWKYDIIFHHEKILVKIEQNSFATSSINH